VLGRTTARARAIAVLFGLAFCSPRLSLARAAKDVLVMKNGDRITCEIKGLENGVLKVNLDYVDGTISVDWLKVARLESSYLFIVNLQDGSLYTAKLMSREEPNTSTLKLSIQPESGQQPRLVDSSAIVGIAQTAETFLRRFGGGISAGATYSKGNQATQYNISSELIYQRTRWGTTLHQNSNLAANTGAETSTRNQLDLGVYRMLSRTNYFLGGIGGFLQSSVQEIDRQTNLGIGLGRFLTNSNRFRFWILGGAGWQDTKYAPSIINQPTQSLGVGFVSTNFQAFSFKKTRLNLSTTVFPALTAQKGRVFYKTNATYYVKLFSEIDWNLSFYGNWDTRPPPTFSASDYGTSIGLSWTFGNK
jgi:hypothetical protein